MMLSFNAHACEGGFCTRSFNRDDTGKVFRDMVKTLKATQDCNEAVYSAKDAFIQRIIYELKTPLHIVTEEITTLTS
jgi:hypothetical protein